MDEFRPACTARIKSKKFSNQYAPYKFLIMVGSSTHHKETMRGLKNLDDDICTIPTNIGEVLRLLTHPKVFSSPLKIEKAVEALSQLINAYDIRILDEDTNW